MASAGQHGVEHVFVLTQQRSKVEGRPCSCAASGWGVALSDRTTQRRSTSSRFLEFVKMSSDKRIDLRDALDDSPQVLVTL